MPSAQSSSAAEPLWEHQLREIEDRWFTKSRALLWSMRTGKSRTIVNTADRLHRYGDLLGVLVLAPNGVHTNWIRRELPKWAPPDAVSAAWSSALSREGSPGFLQQLRHVNDASVRGMRWLSVNDEALINERAQKAIWEFYKSCQGRVLLVADESSLFRRPGAHRTRIARGLAQKMMWSRILDGTAIFNSPLHAFSQFELLQKGALGYDTFEAFKKRYAVFASRQQANGRAFQQIVRYQNMEELRARMGAWSSVVMREDCNDMPDLLPLSRDVVLSDRQRTAYKQMVQELLYTYGEDDEVVAKNGGAKAIKLQQILGGFIMDRRGDVVSIDDSPPILDAMEREVLGTFPGKTIIWCRFREDIRRVVARLRSIGHTPVEYHGGVARLAREEAIDRFQTDDRVTEFVGQPMAGGRGLDLSAADVVLWYSVTPDAIITQQGNERGTQIGGKTVSIVTLATTGTVHDSIVKSNEGKIELADQVSGRGLREWLADNPI